MNIENAKQPGAQEPDPSPGSYYVSAWDSPDGKKYWLILGPFTRHAQALARVEDCRKICGDLDPRAIWFSFGTCKVAGPDPKPGILNKIHHELLCEPSESFSAA